MQRDLVSVPQMLKAHSPSGPFHCPSLCWNVLLPGPRGWLLLHPDQHFSLILVCLSSVVECQLPEDRALVHLASFCTPVLEIVLWHMREAPRVSRNKCVAQVSKLGGHAPYCVHSLLTAPPPRSQWPLEEGVHTSVGWIQKPSLGEVRSLP